VNDVIEVSYTGDLLAHRRCARAWAYEKYAGFQPYEQVQAMEGRLIHHAMEWLAKFRRTRKQHATRDELQAQLEYYFKVLWARGVRTAFTTKAKTIDRVLDHLFPPSRPGQPGTRMHPTVRAAIEGAQHTEYELRTVRKLVEFEHDGKKRLLLTGILDLVIQQQEPLVYERVWEWTNRAALTGGVGRRRLAARPNDLEVWDYKGTRAKSPYLADYVLQLLTYANLYRERTGRRPERCVLFFINEPKPEDKLLAVELDDGLLESALSWTVDRVKDLQKTIRAFRDNPCGVEGGDHVGSDGQPAVSELLSQQCTGCGRRFGCATYERSLPGGSTNRDVDRLNVFTN
jgi:hypothetical protein